MVKRSQPSLPVIETIVVPRSMLVGLLTALHIKLNHPSRHQFQMVLQRQFRFALDMNDEISRVMSACQTCASLQSFPPSLISQSSDDPPEVVGVSFSADVIKCHRQSILVLRECTTSFTASCLIQDERHDTLRDVLTRLIIGLHPLDGPRAIVRVDPAPGFASMSHNDSLKHLNVTIEVGRVKNKNKNFVAEKAVRELEEELIHQEPGGCPVSEVGLAIATARLYSRLRFSGLSSQELWTQRNSSPKNSCQSPILNLYSPNMNCAPLTVPSARSPRTPVNLYPIAKRASDAMTQTRLRQTNRNGGRFS